MAFTIAYDIKAIDKFSDVAEKVRQSMDKLEGSVKKVQRSNEKAIKSFKHLGTGAQKSSAKMNKAISSTNSKLAKQKTMLKDIGTGIDKAGGKISGAGKRMTAGFTVPILGAGAASMKMSMDFNKSMANVGSLIPGQTEKLKNMKNQVLDLSVKTGTGFNDMSGGLYQTISAIGDTADVMKVLEISAIAAKAGVAETKDSVSLLTKVSTAYGDTSAGMIQKVSDMSFLAVKLGVTTFPELAASMGNIASTAQGMGVGMTELFADTAALTKVLGGTAQAATAMDAVMAGLMVGGGDLDDVFAKLGVGSGAALIEKFGGLTGALQAMKTQVGGSEIALKQLFGRKEAQKAAGLLTGSLAGIAADNYMQMANAVGETSKAFDAQTKGINKAGFSFEQAKVQIGAMAVKLGDRLAPILIKILDKLDPFINKFLNMSDASIELGIQIAGVIAAAGPLLMLFGGLLSIVGKVTAAVGAAGGLSGVLAIATGPIGLVVAGIAALVAVIALCWDELKPVRDMLKNELTPIMNSLFSSTDSVSFGFGGLIKAVRGFVGIMAPAWAWIGKLQLRLATLPLRTIIWQFKKLMKFASNVFRIFNALATAAIKVKNKLFGLGETISQWFGEKTKGIAFFDGLKNVLHKIGIYADKVFNKLGKLKNFAMNIPNEITGVIAGGLESLVGDEKGKANLGAAGGGGMAAATMASATQSVKVDVQLHAPEGTVGEVKQKKSGPGKAIVNVGKNKKF